MAARAEETGVLGSSAKWPLSSLVTVLLVAIFLAVTNPSSEQHAEAIRDCVWRHDVLISLLGIGGLASWSLTYRSVLIASYTTFDGKITTAGILGYIGICDGRKRPSVGSFIHCVVASPYS